MKAAVVPEHGRIEVWDIADPRPGPYDCLVKIAACAICTGTDSNIIAGRFPWLTAAPFVLGHESTGLIVQRGDRVRSFELGQRVTRPAGILPGERRDGIGSNWGGFAELGLVRDVDAANADGVKVEPAPTQSRVPLPDGVDPVSAALSINQREILSIAGKLTLGAGSRVVVIGSGYNGLLFSLFCKHFGAGRVVMVGSGPRAELARGAFLADAFADYRGGPSPADIRELLGGASTHVIDAVGSVRSVTFARGLLGPEGAFGRYGVHEYAATAPLVEEIGKTHPALPMGTDELAVTAEWHRLWRQGFFERKGMCDGTVPLADIGEAFERLSRREAVKLVVLM
jgi:threonine dehydrogenase-like Zn-dependent dehydrogenase